MVVGVKGDRLGAFMKKLDRVVHANEFVSSEDSARKAKSSAPFHASGKSPGLRPSKG